MIVAIFVLYLMCKKANGKSQKLSTFSTMAENLPGVSNLMQVLYYGKQCDISYWQKYQTKSCISISLTLSTLCKISADDILKYVFLFFPENRL